jgi:hypothetical protein
MQGCLEAASWFVIVIAVVFLQLHDMDGLAGSRVPHELVLKNCFKVWIVGIIFCRHHLFGDGQIAYVSFIMLFPHLLKLFVFTKY